MADENDVTGAAGGAAGDAGNGDSQQAEKKDKKKSVGAGRPHGEIGAPPKKTVFENTDAELLWPEIISKLPGMGHQPYELAVRVIRVEPPPKEQVGKSFETSAIVGDSSRLSGDVLIQFVTQYYHLPFPWAQGTAQYELQWCWKSTGHIFARGNLRLPGRDQIASAYDAEWRMRREGSGMGTGMGSGMGPMPMPPPPMPPVPQPQGFGAPPMWGYGIPNPYAYPPPQQVQQPPQAAPPPPVQPQPPVQQQVQPPPMHVQPPPAFDHEAERAKIRAEIERDMEMQRMRDELASLKREQRSGFGGVGGRSSDPRDQQFQPQQPQYRPHANPPEPQLSPEVQIARIVVQTLSAMGIVPPGNGNGGQGQGQGQGGFQQQRPGVGAPPPQPQGVVQQAETGLAALEALTSIFDRTRKVTKRLEGVMGGGQTEEQQQQQQEQEQEPEEPPRMGTQLVDVGTSWRDGRPVKAPIDPKTGDIRYDQQGLMAAAFGNPIIGEGVMDFLAGLKQRMMQTPVRAGVGGTPAGGEQVQVRQVVRTEQVRQEQPAEQLPPPPNGTKASPWSL